MTPYHPCGTIPIRHGNDAGQRSDDMNHLFDDIRHPAGINHGTKGVGPYFISSVEINFSTSTEDDAVG